MTEYHAERIAQARHLEGMTQRELSERSHISQSKLSKLQNGFIVFKKTRPGRSPRRWASRYRISRARVPYCP